MRLSIVGHQARGFQLPQNVFDCGQDLLCLHPAVNGGVQQGSREECCVLCDGMELLGPGQVVWIPCTRAWRTMGFG